MLGPGAALGPPSTEALCSPISSENQVRFSPLQSGFRQEMKSKRSVMCPCSMLPDQASQEELQDVLLSCSESHLFIETEEVLSAEQQHAPA